MSKSVKAPDFLAIHKRADCGDLDVSFMRGRVATVRLIKDHYYVEDTRVSSATLTAHTPFETSVAALQWIITQLYNGVTE